MSKFNVFHYRGACFGGPFKTEDEAQVFKDKQKNPSEYFVEGDAEWYRSKIEEPQKNRRNMFKEIAEGIEVLKKERKVKVSKEVKALTKKPKVKSKVKKKVKK
jgi:hypothetical protein